MVGDISVCSSCGQDRFDNIHNNLYLDSDLDSMERPVRPSGLIIPVFLSSFSFAQSHWLFFVLTVVGRVTSCSKSCSTLEGSCLPVLRRLKGWLIKSRLRVAPARVPLPFQDELHQMRLRSAELQDSPIRFEHPLDGRC